MIHNKKLSKKKEKHWTKSKNLINPRNDKAPKTWIWSKERRPRRNRHKKVEFSAQIQIKSYCYLQKKNKEFLTDIFIYLLQEMNWMSFFDNW